MEIDIHPPTLDSARRFANARLGSLRTARLDWARLGTPRFARLGSSGLASPGSVRQASLRPARFGMVSLASGAGAWHVSLAAELRARGTLKAIQDGRSGALNGDAAAVVTAYYAAFNARDMEAFYALVTDDVVHDINQGGREVGKDAFRAFMARMNESYSELLVDLVVMAHPEGVRASAEFVVLGTYLKADEGLPPAHGQEYRLAAGAFFAIRDGKVARITNYYNLPDWIAQVGRG